MTRGHWPLAAAALALALAAPLPARALDKQGSAHGGSVEGATSGVAISGSLMAGLSPYNPTYAARPDNTGHALMRYAAHLDIDLIGRRLSIPIDINMFSDRDRPGAARLLPTELDLIAGLTSTWSAGPGALEVGSRVEHDRPVDREGVTQTYVDARARYLFALAGHLPSLRRALSGGDLRGYATFGWFAFNRGYFARPDNTGLALFRYALHLEVSFWKDRLALGLDAIFFSDRLSDNVVRPTELDFTPEIIARWPAFELHVAYERDMPLDRPGLVQHFVYVLAVWSFTFLSHGAGA